MLLRDDGVYGAAPRAHRAMWELVCREFVPKFGATTPWCVWVAHGTPAHAHKAALAEMPLSAADAFGGDKASSVAGTGSDKPFFEVWPEGGMELDMGDTAAVAKVEAARARWEGRKADSGVVVTRLQPDDTSGLHGYIQVLCDAFEVPTGAAVRTPVRQLFGGRKWGSEGGLVQLYVARDGNATGDVVGCALVLHMPQSKAAGIFEVAVKSTHRRRGIATGLMLATLDDATRAGATRVALQASPEGKGVYARLGFQETTAFDVFVHFPGAIPGTSCCRPKDGAVGGGCGGCSC